MLVDVTNFPACSIVTAAYHGKGMSGSPSLATSEYVESIRGRWSLGVFIRVYPAAPRR